MPDLGGIKLGRTGLRGELHGSCGLQEHASASVRYNAYPGSPSQYFLHVLSPNKSSQATRVVHLRLPRDLHYHLLAGEVPHDAGLVPPWRLLCRAVLDVILEQDVSRAHDLHPCRHITADVPIPCFVASHPRAWQHRERTFTAPSVALMCHLPLIVTTNWTWTTRSTLDRACMGH